MCSHLSHLSTPQTHMSNKQIKINKFKENMKSTFSPLFVIPLLRPIFPMLLEDYLNRCEHNTNPVKEKDTNVLAIQILECVVTFILIINRKKRNANRP